MKRPWLDGMLKALADNPIVTWVLVAGVATHLTLGMLGLHVYRCGFLSMTGLPCPGCGMSTGIVLLFKGDWSGMWRAHPFAPYFGALGLGVFVLGVLPRTRRHAVIGVLSRIERGTHINAVLLAAFVVHGVVRLLLRMI